MLLQSDVERFFSAEAEMLDERRFDDWLELLHEDLHYWMPIARNVRFDAPELEYTREHRDANWFDEGKDTLRKRVQQIQGGDHWAEEPRSRTTHLVANVRVAATNGADITVKCRFIVYTNRLEHEFEFFVGKRVDVLRRDEWDVDASAPRDLSRPERAPVAKPDHLLLGGGDFNAARKRYLGWAHGQSGLSDPGHATSAHEADRGPGGKAGHSAAKLVSAPRSIQA